MAEQVSSGQENEIKLLKRRLNRTSFLAFVLGYTVIAERKNPVKSLKITADGKWIVCVEDKTGVLLIEPKGDIQTPNLLTGIEKNIKLLALAPDNITFYSVGSENIIEYRDLPGGRSRRFAETRARITQEEWKTFIGPDIQYEKMQKKE